MVWLLAIIAALLLLLVLANDTARELLGDAFIWLLKCFGLILVLLLVIWGFDALSQESLNAPLSPLSAEPVENNHSQFWLDWSVQVATAIGTIGAVVVALFGSWLRGKLTPPKLILSLKDPQGTRTPVTLTDPDGSQRQSAGRWYHIRIENRRRWSPAHQVQVFLLRVEEPDAAGENQMTWIGEIPMNWRHQEVNPIMRTVGAGADCDLCSVVRDKWLELHPLVVPHSLNARRREPCRLTVTLQARSIEADSDLLRVQIAWDGKWSEDGDNMMQHAVVKQL